MGKLNQDFHYRRAFDFITFLVLILFLGLFLKSIITVMDAFETEVYTNTVSELSKISR